MRKIFMLLTSLVLSSSLYAEEATADIQQLQYESVCNIEFYVTVIAVAVCLGLGLVMWRLILLSKNQRSIF
jgi:hypothetical protein